MDLRRGRERPGYNDGIRFCVQGPPCSSDLDWTRRSPRCPCTSQTLRVLVVGHGGRLLVTPVSEVWTTGPESRVETWMVGTLFHRRDSESVCDGIANPEYLDKHFQFTLLYFVNRVSVPVRLILLPPEETATRPRPHGSLTRPHCLWRRLDQGKVLGLTTEREGVR